MTFHFLQQQSSNKYTPVSQHRDDSDDDDDEDDGEEYTSLRRPHNSGKTNCHHNILRKDSQSNKRIYIVVNVRSCVDIYSESAC